MKNLIIAEKPSVAKDIAKTLNVTEFKDTYIEGDQYIVTWAFGHLVQLAEPEEYGFKTWDINDLPIIPDEFIYEVKNDTGVKKQFNSIKKLVERNDVAEIINATDAGREGEAIFRYIYMLLNSKKPIKRLWISSLTQTAIEDGFKKLQPGEQYRNLFYSAKLRNEADWLIGINATRYATLKSGSSSVLSLGRVQTPTLYLITNRYIENKNFKPTDYYKAQLLINDVIKATFEQNFNSEQEAKAFLDDITEVKHIDSEVKEIQEKAPLALDLTTLQTLANKKHKLKAQKTLDIVQSLYEKKITTYPRTDSRYLTTDMMQHIASKLDTLSPLTDISIINKNALNEAVFNNEKVSDHHAIIPTFENLTQVESLETDERNVFSLILDYFLASLAPNAIKEQTTYHFLTNNENKLKVSGSVYTTLGWKKIIAQEGKKEDILPNLKDAKVSISSKLIDKKRTQAPALYTEGTLLSAMENLGNSLDDKEDRLVMKGSGIGTPATRASIIESLFKRKFITDEKNKLIPTELGLNLFNEVKDLNISSPQLTADLEKELKAIELGEKSFTEVQQMVVKYTKDIIQNLSNIKAMNTTNLKCPFCENKMLKSKYSYYCSCDFKIPYSICSKTITEEQINDLLKDGKTSLIKGFKSKAGKVFNAFLKLNEEKKIEFEFEQKGGVMQTSNFECPKCQNKLNSSEKVLKCSSGECDFILFKNICSKTITEEQINDLLKDGKTSLIKGFKSKKGNKFNAFLKLNEEKKIEFEFEQK